MFADNRSGAYDELITVRTVIEVKKDTRDMYDSDEEVVEVPTFEDFHEYRGVLSFHSLKLQSVIDGLDTAVVDSEGRLILQMKELNLTWRLFRDWMFRGGEITTNVGDGIDGLNLRRLADFKQLLALYHFAEEYGITDLENTVLGLYFTRSVLGEGRLWSERKELYDATTRYSTLRLLHVEMLVHFRTARHLINLVAKDDYINACHRQYITPFELLPLTRIHRNEYRSLPYDRSIIEVLWKNDFCVTYHRHMTEPTKYRWG